MRVARNVRQALRLDRLHRGYARLALRPGRAGLTRPTELPREVPAGGVIVGPPGARRLVLDMVRSEISAGCYVNEGRLAAALDRLIAAL
jgi:hypothetical protein